MIARSEDCSRRIGIPEPDELAKDGDGSIFIEESQVVQVVLTVGFFMFRLSCL